MATILLPLLPGTLPSGVCYSSEQERLNAYMAVSNAQLAGGYAFYNYGSDTPSVENQAYPWFRTTDGLWYYFQGVWRSPRPKIEQSTGYRIMWTGDEADIPNIDGGSAGVVTPTTGPFWEKDTDFAGRSPMAPGLIPSSNPSKTLSVAENFGEGAHAQTAAELASHSHTPDATLADGFLGHAVAGAPATYNVLGGGDTISMGSTATTGDGDAANVVHPVRGIWILKPTARLFYTV